MVVALKHLSEEIVRSRNWHSRLDQYPHSSHDIIACQIVAIQKKVSRKGCLQRDLTLDVVVHSCQLRDLHRVLVRDGHVLRERNTPLFLH